jgi:hypothetical protein
MLKASRASVYSFQVCSYFRPHAAQTVDEPLDRAQHRRKDVALAVEDLLHVAAQQRRDGDEQDQVEDDLHDLQARHIGTPPN